MRRLFPLLLGLLLAGCATTGPTTKTLTAQDNGQTIRVAVHATLVVQLSSNPTTGYSWEPAGKTLPVLKLFRSSHAPAAGLAGMPGMSGTDTFRFEVVQPGQQRLQLNYVRPWEKGVPPAQTVAYDIIAAP
jgi:inhibitor of cysteine peptidase